MTPFILRFQEICDPTDARDVVAGTATITAVHAEQMDTDPDKKRHGAFGHSAEAGTATKTRVLAETSDEDQALCQRGLFRAIGTQTSTFVARERGDTDRHAQQHRALSQCSSS